MPALRITNAKASTAIIAAASEGRLVQGSWHQKQEGRELACLLGSIHPKVKSAEDCNAHLMPLWMAEVTIRLFDALPQDAVVPTALRYGSLIARRGDVKPDAWDGIMRAFLVRCIDDALDAARPVSEGKPYWPAVEKASAESRRVIVEKDNANAAAYAAYASHKLFMFLLDQIEGALAQQEKPV